MDKVILTEQLTAEEIQAYEDKCTALAEQNNVSKVHACVIVTPNTFERQVCFLKDPNFSTKLNVLNKMATLGVYPGANELREACTIKDASSPLTYGDSPECDSYKLGVVNFCMGIIDSYKNVLDKKK